MKENYINMLEIPVNSSSVTFKPIKKKKKDVKKQVIEMVNGDTQSQTQDSQTAVVERIPVKKKRKIKKSVVQEAVAASESSVKKGGFDIISAQVVAIFALIVGIILTNIFWEDSGMNVLFRNVFNKEDISSSVYTSFTAYAPSKTSSVTLEEGIMTIESGSVYAPCGGVVSSIVESEGLYSVTISHSSTFSTVISGLENVYAQIGATVYENVPVGYSKGKSFVSMFDSDAILTGYMLSGNQIVWLG